MEQEVIDALILKLHELFPDIKAYDTKVEMDLEPPLFLIQVTDTQLVDRITPGGFFYTYFFDVMFFPGNDQPEVKIREIELPLVDGIHHFGEHFRAEQISTKRFDGVLHCQFRVRLNLHRDKRFPKIEDIQTGVKAHG